MRLPRRRAAASAAASQRPPRRAANRAAASPAASAVACMRLYTLASLGREPHSVSTSRLESAVRLHQRLQQRALTSRRPRPPRCSSSRTAASHGGAAGRRCVGRAVLLRRDEEEQPLAATVGRMQTAARVGRGNVDAQVPQEAHAQAHGPA
jgi:hypothetical protein